MNGVTCPAVIWNPMRRMIRESPSVEILCADPNSESGCKGAPNGLGFPNKMCGRTRVEHSVATTRPFSSYGNGVCLRHFQ